MPKAKKGKRKSESPLEASQSDDGDSVGGGGGGNQGMSFSQLAPEVSQDIYPVKPSEQRNLDSLGPEQREKVLMDLTRLILFKALAGEPIDRLKCCKEAGIGSDQGKHQGKISSAAFAEAAERLRNVFGYELKRIPRFMEANKSFPARFKDRYYVVTSTLDDVYGSHSKVLYAVHDEAIVEKGFLMVVLALVFCKGDPRSDGSRWIWDADLYRLLNAVDENIPHEPPAQGPSAKKGPSRRLTFSSQGRSGVGMTPDADHLLELYVKMDYLLREKISEDKLSSTPSADENSVVYSLGPRSAIEIGRKQIVYFCAEILDEEPDPTMLMELEGDEVMEDEE